MPWTLCLLCLGPVDARPRSIIMSSLLDQMVRVSFPSHTWHLSNARTYGYVEFKTWLCVCLPQTCDSSTHELICLSENTGLPKEASSFSRILLFSQGALQILQNPLLARQEDYLQPFKEKNPNSSVMPWSLAVRTMSREAVWCKLVLPAQRKVTCSSFV